LCDGCAESSTSSYHKADVKPDYSAWKKLQQLHSSKQSKLVLKDLFGADSSRFSNLSKQFTSSSPDVSLLLDYSKNLVDDEVLSALFELAREAKVEQFRDSMFAGDHVNTSEDRAVLHVALRNPKSGGFNIKEAGVDEVHDVLAHMKEFSEQVRSGEWKGYTGKKIDTIVNIGIGGSDLGPVMVCEALKHYSKRDLKMHFVSNIDGTDLAEVLKSCDRETTIFIVASKTFTTQETITNATSAKDWFLESAKDVSPCAARHYKKISLTLSPHTSPSTLSLSPPTPMPSPNSVSTRPTCLLSGIGLEDDTLSGPQSVFPSVCPSASTTSKRCSTVLTPWTSTLHLPSLKTICPSSSPLSVSGTTTSTVCLLWSRTGHIANDQVPRLRLCYLMTST